MKKNITFTILFFICNAYALTGIDSLWQEYEKQRQFPKTAFKILDQITNLAQKNAYRDHLYQSIREEEVMFNNQRDYKSSGTEWDRYIKIYNLYANQPSSNDLFIKAHFEMKKAESLVNLVTSRLAIEPNRFENTITDNQSSVDNWDFVTCRKKIIEYLNNSLTLINLSKEKIARSTHISYFDSDYNYYSNDRDSSDNDCLYGVFCRKAISLLTNLATQYEGKKFISPVFFDRALESSVVNLAENDQYDTLSFIHQTNNFYNRLTAYYKKNGYEKLLPKINLNKIDLLKNIYTQQKLLVDHNADYPVYKTTRIDSLFYNKYQDFIKSPIKNLYTDIATAQMYDLQVRSKIYPSALLNCLPNIIDLKNKYYKPRQDPSYLYKPANTADTIIVGNLILYVFNSLSHPEISLRPTGERNNYHPDYLKRYYYLPNQKFKINIYHKNMDSINVLVFDKFPVDYNDKYSYTHWRDYAIKTISLKFKKSNFFEQKETVEFDGLLAGDYYFVFDIQENFNDYYSFKASFSTMAYFSSIKNGYQDLILFDRANGSPIDDAKVYVCKSITGRNNWLTNFWQSTFIDSQLIKKNGVYQIDRSEFGLRIKRNTEELFSDGIYRNSGYELYDKDYANVYYNSNNHKSPIYNSLKLYTDKKIYHPGEDIQIKGLVYKNDKDNPGNKTVRKGIKRSVVLRSPRYSEVGNLEATTNDFGSFSGTISLPKNCQTGAYTFETGSINDTIWVEEYKKAKFNVNFLPSKSPYAIGDSVEVHGLIQAYAGYNLNDSQVKYTISVPIDKYSDRKAVIASGQICSDNDGNFTFKFIGSYKEYTPDSVSFNIAVDVTDITGESHVFNKKMKLFKYRLKLDSDLPNFISNQKEDTQIKINSFDSDLNPQNCRVKILINRMHQKNQINSPTISKNGTLQIDTKIIRNNFKSDSLVFSTIGETNDSLGIVLPTSSYQTGVYRLQALGTNLNNQEIIMERFFVVYNPEDSKIPINTDFLIIPASTTMQTGQPLQFYVGTANKEGNIYYEIINRMKTASAKYLTISDKLQKIEIPFDSLYFGGFYVNFMGIYQNNELNQTINIAVPWNHKKLNIAQKKFISKLKPGTEVEWEFKIETGTKADKPVEMAIAMTDASLEQIKPNNWQQSFFPNTIYNLPVFANNSLNKLFFLGGRGGGDNSYSRMESFSIVQKDADQFGKPSLSPFGLTKIRTDFRETAFFQPHLYPDSSGIVSVKFKTPDALTQWKIMALAHTEDLQSGYLETTSYTDLSLMVESNPPRYFRENDTIYFSSKIVNISKKQQNGVIKLELIDSQTRQIINQKFNLEISEQKFISENGQSVPVKWKIIVPNGLESVIYRVTAVTDSESDGEENIIPILPNRTLVTETLPFYIQAQTEKDFTFNKLKQSNQSNTCHNYRLSFEYTNNPVFATLFALPSLIYSQNESSEATFARYFTNSLADYILKTDIGGFNKIIKSWQNDKSQFKSNLMKNSELKSIQLSETPWVSAAKDDSTRKENLLTIFDTERIAYEQPLALRKIIESQNTSGSWSWFKGMNENSYITAHMLNGFAKMSALNLIDLRNDYEIWRMIANAVNNLDSKLAIQYNVVLDNKKTAKERQISYEQIYYLYVRSYFKDIPVRTDCLSAYEYYMNQVKEYCYDFNFYAQGQAALILHRNGNQAKAQEIARSLTEKSISNQEIGIYWESRNSPEWYESKISQNALMIEVFSEISQDKSIVDELKKWLINARRTENWQSSKATTEAIFALLTTDRYWSSTLENPEIKVGDYNVVFDEQSNFKSEKIKKADKIEAGTGYFKTSWQGSDIKADMGDIKIKNNNKLPAWGAVYWQYFEDLDKITSAETPLKLKKQLYIERPSDKGPVLVHQKKNTAKIGDRIKVRIELRVDRDMEYVHMKDMRASGFEPENVMSGYRWQGGLGYYESTRDAATNFFFDYLHKGTYVFEYPVRVAQAGDFSNGVTSIQCMYAPEFSSHSEGVRVRTNFK